MADEETQHPGVRGGEAISVWGQGAPFNLSCQGKQGEGPSWQEEPACAGAEVEQTRSCIAQFPDWRWR